MIITRSLARQLRGVFRKAAPRSSTFKPAVSLTAGSDGLHVRLHGGAVLVEFHQLGSLLSEIISLPFETFADFEGRNDSPVNLAKKESSVQARWDDGGLPQFKDYEGADPAKLPEFPTVPAEMTTADAGLFKALADAAHVAARDAIRYTVDHLLLKGSNGTLIATDGHQLLVQEHHWPWSDDVLVPSSAVFSSKEFGDEQPVHVGKSNTHVTLKVGPWTIHLPVNKEGRFPKIEEVLPKPRLVTARGQLTSEDCAFLAKALPRLSASDDDDAPVTLDLNERVHIRAKAQGQNRVTEIVLTGSQAADKPARIALNRHFLARAMQLGLHDIHVVSAEAPLLFQDEKRKFVIMPLGKDSAIPPSADAVIITSTAETRNCINNPSTVRRKPAVNEPQVNGDANENGNSTSNGNTGKEAATNADSRRRKAKSTGLAALIEEAESLKAVLRDAHLRAHELLTALKQQRKQRQVVESSLRALRDLQNVE